jgi:hypothetical protein
MIRGGNDNSLPYRAPVTAAPATPEYSKDEAQYDTIVRTLGVLDERIAALYSDFNAFDILKLLDTPQLDQAQKKLLVQIMAKQEAYDILIEAREGLHSAAGRADENYKQRNNQ